MTNEQRRYKIVKKQSYEELMNDEEKTAAFRTFALGLSLSAAAICFGAGSNIEIDSGLRLMDIAMGIMNTGFAVKHLKDLLEAINNKTMYKSRIVEIKEELDMPEEKEQKDDIKLIRR